MVLIKRYGEAIKKAESLAFVRRVMWKTLDERVQKVFEACLAQESELRAFGNLYIRRASDEEPIRSSGLLSSQYTNSIHIYTGHRLLGISFVDKENNTLKIASESHAQLWYSQGPSGEVFVFVAPYKSDVGRVEEKEVIIGRYEEPASVSENMIKHHFNTFLKYCACTNQHANNLNSFLYRKKLMLGDFRYRHHLRSKIIKTFEKLIVIIFSIATVWATLYAGGNM